MRLIYAFLISCAVMAFAAPVALSQQSSGTLRWSTTQVNVGTSATLVAPNRPTRVTVRVQTNGTNQVVCGPDNTVIAGTGIPINPTANSYFEVNTTAEVWCIAAAAQGVAVMENY